MDSKSVFERTRALLRERGFTEDEVDPYTGQTFGSWWIAVAHQPRLRIVWEGRDQWMIIDRETNRPRHWDPHGREWDVMWGARHPDESNAAEEVVRALESLRDFGSDARTQPS